MAFDADALIYFVEEHDEFLKIIEPVIEMVDVAEVYGYASTVTLLEVLVGPIRSGLVDLADKYRAILTRSRNFELHDLTRVLADYAAVLRARYELRTPDAIVAASALELGCSHLITNDSGFRRLNEGNLKVLIISDFI